MIKKILSNKKTIFFFIIILVMLGYFHSYFNTTTMPARGDDPMPKDVHSTDLMAILGIYPMEIRHIIDEYGQFPFWSPYILGGTPIFSKPQAVFFYINLPIILFAPTIFAGIKWSMMLHFLISAIAMFALVHHITKDDTSSFVASFVYTFNAYMISRLNWGQTNVIYAYAWIPLVFLFTLLALEKKKWLHFSIFVGISFSLIVLGGGAQQFMYLSVVYFYFLAIYLLLNISREKILSNIIKIARMSIIVLVVFFGLTSIFILPNRDLVNSSVRSEGYSYEQSLGSPYSYNFQFFKDISTPNFTKKPFSDWESTGVGIIAFIFSLLSLAYFRKRKMAIFFIAFIFLLLVFSGTFFFKVFWKLIPQFQQAKGIFKGHYLIMFFLSLFSGFGFLYYKEYIAKKNYSKYLVLGAALLIMFNLTIFNNKLTMMTDPYYELSKNEVLQYISKDTDLFRYKAYETRGIDWGTDHYTVLMGLSDVMGTENIWPVEYLPIFLNFANTYPEKGYIILNMKYMTSMSEINISGFKLVKKFNECGFYPNGADICQPRKSDGPYLYQNEEVLPRAFYASNGILILGDEQKAQGAAYFLMANENFDPKTTVIVHNVGNTDNIDEKDLVKFGTVILLEGAFGDNYQSKLQRYKSTGGKLLPDLTGGQTSISEKDLQDVLKSTKQSKIDNAKIEKYTPNSIKINLESEKKFLVVSELFSLYPGWSAYDENGDQVRIFRSDGVVSTVLLDQEKNIEFRYKEPSFFKGALISGTTLALILAYFIYLFIASKKEKHAESKN